MYYVISILQGWRPVSLLLVFLQEYMAQYKGYLCLEIQLKWQDKKLKNWRTQWLCWKHGSVSRYSFFHKWNCWFQPALITVGSQLPPRCWPLQILHSLNFLRCLQLILCTAVSFDSQWCGGTETQPVWSLITPWKADLRGWVSASAGLRWHSCSCWPCDRQYLWPGGTAAAKI